MSVLPDESLVECLIAWLKNTIKASGNKFIWGLLTCLKTEIYRAEEIINLIDTVLVQDL
jgi:hypothetical protein